MAPQDINQAVTALASDPGQVRLLVGGTDLLVQMRSGKAAARLVVDLKQIRELSQIEYDPERGLVIGAAASCARLAAHPQVQRFYPGLADAVGLIGGVQIQNRASLGGNLCNASPAADGTPALIVLGAICEIAGTQGRRQVAVQDFCTAPGKNCLQPDELLVSLHLPLTALRSGSSYLRFIPRNEMDIAVVGVGASVTLDETGEYFELAQIALGAVGPTALLAEEAGASLLGRQVSEETLVDAARLAQAAARPISDLRGSREQRLHLVGVLTRRALRAAIERARTQPGSLEAGIGEGSA